jgi:rare lipoprotein A
MRARQTRSAVCLVAAVTVLAACSSVIQDGPPSRTDRATPVSPGRTPAPEPLSRYGNGPEYEVLGKRYRVMPSASGFSERGVASWYGSKFHGRLTSNREVYDMYAMTAAHKTLPLPTWVEVRNLRNNRSVVVRVNDRGPFVHNRVIDLSYAAARELEMLDDGTSLVEIRALNFDAPTGDRPVRAVTPAAPPAAGKRGGNDIYVQVGAFGSRDNAERRRALLRQNDIGNVEIRVDETRSPALYRVHIGPVQDVFAYDRIVDELAGIGINDPYLVTR